MNRVLIHICGVVAVLATMFVSSCSREESNSLEVPSQSILVAMPGQTGTTSFDSSNITSITVTSTPAGWTVNSIDMYASTITVTAPSSFDNEEVESGTLSLKGYTPTGDTTTLSIYLAIVPKEVDYSNAPANCYVACQPATRYKFDPKCGGNGSVELATAEVKILWQTEVDLVKYLDMRDGYATFYIAPAENEDGEELSTVVPGNALIAAYNESGDIIWSWHIWVTNNDPMAAENTFELNGVTMMNHNLGADTNNEGEADSDAILRSYGLYYQWGRKEPIPGPHTSNFAGNYDDILYNNKGYEVKLQYEESAVGGSVAWTTANPLSVVKGDAENAYDWLNGAHDNTLWSATAKSDSDPCPAGWRVPDSSVFKTLTIAEVDDAMPWAEAQTMYGWMLEDTATGNTHFFSAAGRRNYLDGRLDNMNTNDELPVPWSGYYWSTSVEGTNAKALYFNLNTNTRTWNGIESERAMQRANAMPVRCVKE
ncbi:MAG: hypothetical protein J6V26_03915 [Alistipes sp.]|nr:hypothetical protein [Alistipes sp.]